MRHIFFKLSLVSLLSFIFLFPCCVSAQKTILDFKDEVFLNEKQIEECKKIIEDFEKQAKPLKQKIMFLEREIKNYLRKGGYEIY